jgi:outer membrane protein TolC
MPKYYSSFRRLVNDAVLSAYAKVCPRTLNSVNSQILSMRRVNSISWLVGPCLLIAIAGRALTLCQARAQNFIDERPERFDLSECVAIALANQPAISVQERAAQIAAEQVAIARSFYLPQIVLQGRYAAIDEPRTVDINNPIPASVIPTFSDAATYFGIARAAGTAAADFALNNPNVPLPPVGQSFNSLSQQAAASLPASINVGLLGENSVQSQLAGVQPLWTGGKIEAQVRRAEIGSRAAGLSVVRTRQLTEFHVSQAYYSILLVTEQAQIVQEGEDHAKAIERLSQSLLDAGDEAVTSVDALRASTFRNLYGEQRAGFARLQERAYAALKLAMGFDQAVEMMIADRALTFTAVDLSNEQVVAAALTNRPEVIQARLGMNAANWQYRAARAELLPDVVAFAGFGTIHDDAGFPNPNDSEEWSAGVGAQLPLFLGGRRTAQIRQAQHARAQARDQYDQARQFVSQEAQDAFLEYREMSERMAAAAGAAAAADRALEDLRDQFRNGLIPDDKVPKYFEDALTTRFLTVASWSRYYQAVYGYNLALARLRLATATDEPFLTSSVEELPPPDVGDSGVGVD